MSATANLAPASAAFAPRLVGTKRQSTLLVWTASVGGAIALAALFAANQSTLLRAAVPAVATMVGLTLYLRRPIGYIHFTLWTWFLAPLIRRLIDWRFGFEDQSLVLLAPCLVTSIAALTLLREREKFAGLDTTPFMLCIAGVTYGFCVGVVRALLHVTAEDSLPSAAYGLLTWLTPIFFGLHLYLHWRDYEAQRDAIQRSFLFAVLLLGLYGIFQYVNPPAWDRAWLEGLPGGYENASFGRPFPYEIRVWSTSNSPGTFATVLLAGLVLLSGVRSRIKPLILTAGFFAMLLSMVRTAWLAWVVAIAILATSYRGAKLRNFVLGIFLLPLFALPVLFNSQIRDNISDRLSTMNDLGHDDSMNDRRMMYRVVTGELTHNPAGIGLRNSSALEFDGYVLDSGFLQAALMLGFAGSAVFAIGIGIATFRVTMRGATRQSMPYGTGALAARAIFLTSLVELIAGNIFINISGVVLWSSFALLASFDAKTRPLARPIDRDQLSLRLQARTES